jgi:hypothetical protein
VKLQVAKSDAIAFVLLLEGVKILGYNSQQKDLAGFRVGRVSYQESRYSCNTIPECMISFLVGMFFLDQVSRSSTNSVGCVYGTELKALDLIYWVLCSFLDITTQPNISNFQPHQNEDHQQN